MNKLKSIQVMIILLVLLLAGAFVYYQQSNKKTTSTSNQVNAENTHQVMIKNFAYEPSEINAKVGDKIIFKNLDLASHTATADDGSTFDTGLIGKDEEGSITLTKSGTIDYHCAPHPKMRGKIIVQ